MRPSVVLSPRVVIAAIVAVLALLGISVAGVSYRDARQYAKDQVDSASGRADKQERYDMRVKDMANLPEDGSGRDLRDGEGMRMVPPSEWNKP